MKSEIVRKIDELGRIVLPAEMRNILGWNRKSQIVIRSCEGGILLTTYNNTCCICGSEENLKSIHDKYVCQRCIDEINNS